MFSEREADHSDVVVPISSGHVHERDEQGLDPESKTGDTASLSSGSAGGFSIESLRAEVESDIAVDPSGKATAYDSM